MMHDSALRNLKQLVADIAPSCPVGRVTAVDGHLVTVTGLENEVKQGDRLKLFRQNGTTVMGEVLRMNANGVTMLPDEPTDQIALADRVVGLGANFISPSIDWIGRILDPYGMPLDGSFLRKGDIPLDVYQDPPPPVSRKPLGSRLTTGFHIFNTMLPIVRGQRVGIFAGSGVGKSLLMGDFVNSIDADVVVLALVGERGREIRDFTQDVLGQSGMARTVVVAASADSSAAARLRCPQTAMRIAEWFRDQGQHVLLIVDSISRFAEAQREASIMGGEFPSLRGFPPSTPSKIMKLAERAGPGSTGNGDITALFSVLVAGSDMNEPIADMLRGVLDGHIVLDRSLAEKGQFPAVDLLKSVSRALPRAASDSENIAISQARALVSEYDDASTLINAGLYTEGTDAGIDRAIAFHDPFSEFLTGRTSRDCEASFEKLLLCLRRNGIPDNLVSDERNWRKSI